MSTYRLTKPSYGYERWRNEPCELIKTMQEKDGVYVDVLLTGDKDKGLILRVRADRVETAND